MFVQVLLPMGIDKYQFGDALYSCLEIHMSLSPVCVFEPLRKMCLFLETPLRLKFCVFQLFYCLRSMYRV